MTASIHSLVAAYAVNALNPAERDAVERHLAECDDCRADLTAFRAVTTSLADAQALSPPASLRERVMSDVARTAQLTPRRADAPVTDPIRVAATFGVSTDQVGSEPADARTGSGDELAGSGDELAGSSAALAGSGDELATHRAQRARRRWLPALAGAAATVAVVALGVGIAANVGGEDAELAMEKDVMMVASAPDAASADLDLGTGHVVTSERMDSYALMGAAAPMPDKGTEYQVWLILEDGSKVAGPTFMPGDDGEYMTVMHSDAQDVVAVAVTCEPPGGSDEPTSDAVSVVEL
jgi:anti-sigma-K factor RskA